VGRKLGGGVGVYAVALEESPLRDQRGKMAYMGRNLRELGGGKKRGEKILGVGIRQRGLRGEDYERKRSSSTFWKTFGWKMQRPEMKASRKAAFRFFGGQTVSLEEKKKKLQEKYKRKSS